MISTTQFDVTTQEEFVKAKHTKEPAASDGLPDSSRCEQPTYYIEKGSQQLRENHGLDQAPITESHSLISTKRYHFMLQNKYCRLSKFPPDQVRPPYRKQTHSMEENTFFHLFFVFLTLPLFRHLHYNLKATTPSNIEAAPAMIRLGFHSIWPLNGLKPASIDGQRLDL